MSEATTPTGSRWEGYRAATIIAIIALCIGLVAYGGYQRRAVGRANAQAMQAASALAETRGQVDALSAKMNDMIAAEQARQLREQRAQEAARHARTTTVRRKRVDDPRWKKVQSELEAHQQALEAQRQALDATRGDLSSTKTELSGSIARTHEELVALQKRGERNYYEFDLRKGKQFSASGPVGIKLRKANNKHQYADLQLMVDDAQLDKKHVNLFEPVTFLNTDSGQPVQLVINKIDKDRIHGYVSEPKYKAAQLTATSQTDGTPSVPPQRRKLEVPR